MWSAAPSWVPIIVTGNVVGLLIGLLALALWVRRQFKQHVSDPLTRLQSSVDSLTKSDSVLASEVETARALAQRAHDRIDAVMLGENKNA